MRAMQVLITGANRGIGLAMTQQLTSRGDSVIACCRTSSKELVATGAQIVEGLDLTDPHSHQALFERVGSQPIDILINNAGLLLSDNLENLDPANIRRQFEINALTPLLLTKAMLATMRKPGAKVALITSRMGSIEDNTSGGQYGYRMSKVALNMAGVSLAHDLKPEGISVCILHPGYVRTGMTNYSGIIDPEESAQGLIARIDALTLESSGQFWHSNGDLLPW